jgi:hypothetical protein
MQHGRMKLLGYEILWESIKDCLRSKRELAKVLKISTLLLQEGEERSKKIEGCTAIPKWENRFKFQYPLFH